MIDIQEKAAFLLNKHQIVAALEANILYRIKEIEEKNGTVTREVTVNDGRYDGDKRDELNRLRMLLLKGQEEKTLIETKLLKCQEEKNQLGSENSNLYNENIKLFSECEKKDSIIAALQNEVEELRNTSAIARDTEQATQNKIMESLRDQLQNEKQENAQNKKQSRELKKSLQSTADKVTGQTRRKDELLSTVQQQKQLLREQNSELTKARNANDDLSTKLRMIQVSYESLCDDKDIAQAAVITHEEQIFMAKEEIICKDIQIGELRNKLATVEKNSDGDNTTSTKNTANNELRVDEHLDDELNKAAFTSEEVLHKQLTAAQEETAAFERMKLEHNNEELFFEEKDDGLARNGVASEIKPPTKYSKQCRICGRVPGLFEFPFVNSVCCFPSCRTQVSAMMNGTSMSHLEEKIEGQNDNEDDDVPIPRMMSANEYHANQLALQKKAGLAKHNA